MPLNDLECLAVEISQAVTDISIKPDDFAWTEGQLSDLEDLRHQALRLVAVIEPVLEEAQ